MIEWKSSKTINFGGNKGEANYSLHNGFTLIRGPNGAGKSTAFASLSWCLYGKTDKGVRAGAVVYWGEKKASVESIFEVDGERVILFRQQGPNRLQMNGNTVEQEAIDAIFGPYSMFLSSVVFGQVGTKFLSMRPAEQQEMIGSLIGIDRWDSFLDGASRNWGASKEGVSQAINAVDFARKSLQQIEEIKIIDTRPERLKDTNEKMTEVRAELRVAKSNVIPSPKKPSIETIFHDKSIKIARDIREIDQRIRSLNSEIRSAKSGGKCSRCGSILKDQSAIDRHVESIAEKIRKANEEKTATEDVQSEILTNLDSEETGNSSIMREYEKEVRSSQESDLLVTRLTRERDSLNQTALSIQDEKDPRDDINRRIKKAQGGVLEEESRLKKRESSERVSKDVFESVQLLRRSVLSGALEMISERINGSLIDLGLDGWTVEFETAALTGTGSIKKSLSTMIYPPGSSKAIPLLSYSGGETQRLLLASSFAFVDLAAALGFRWNIEVYDECTRGVDIDGIKQYFGILEKRAKSEGVSIFAIEHHPSCADFAHNIVDLSESSSWGGNA